MKILHSFNKRTVLILVLIILCVAISGYFQSIKVGTVYTHLFYVPIVISCIWWQKKGILIAILLGLVSTIFHIIFRQEISILNDLLRAFMFIIIAILVSKISHLEKHKTFLLHEEKEKLQESLKKLADEKRKLETSYIGLDLKNNSLANKEKKIKHLEKQIKELKNR